jgi:signal peptidase I
VQTRYGPKHRAKPARKHAASPKKKRGRASAASRRTAPEELRDVTQPQVSSHSPSEETAAPRRVSESPEGAAHRSPGMLGGQRKVPDLHTQKGNTPMLPESPAAAPLDDHHVYDARRATKDDPFAPAPKRKVIASESKPPRQSFGQFLKELPVLILVALVIAILVKTFVMQAFFIPSGSMENTLQVGDRVLVVKFLYRFVEPKHPDVVVFRSPLSAAAPEPERNIFGKVANEIAEGLGLRSSEQDFIKRVIATEGQTVEIKVGSVFVNNQKIVEPYRHDLDPLPDYPPTVIPPGKVFVMGDNRKNSEDSRVFGPISKSSIIGRAFVLIWPLDRVRWLGG